MIKIEKLSFQYEDKAILRDINLQIREGDFIAMIGHNGSGKTTLIKHFNGLLIPTKGEVIVDSLNTRDNNWEIKQKIGFVFQNPEDQLINSIVEEDVAFGPENLGLHSDEIKKNAKNILKKLHISHLAKENVNSLSFGQKQLVALAGVLVMKPKYIVFDEPTSVLDPRNKANIKMIMRKLNKEGVTIILVTQNLEDIRDFVKRVIVLSKGKIVFDDKKGKLNKTILKKADLYG